MTFRVLAIALVSAIPALVEAQETPAIGRGIAPDKLYQTGDVDSVDLQSGALSVAIPIGSPYPLSERFSYSFSLHHSSRNWDFEPAQEGYLAYPNRRSNSGLGWSLQFGLLIHPDDSLNPGDAWRYISEDGADHQFHPVLHGEEEEGDDGSAPDSVDYTTDSTYLRLQHLAGDIHEVEFPDGTIKKFEHESGTTYRITEIRDRFGPAGSPQNWVRFAYPDSLTWNVTDSRGRLHTVKFVSLTYDGASKPMVNYLDLAAFDGTPARWARGSQAGRAALRELADTAQRLANIAADGRPRMAQAMRASAAQSLVVDYGGGHINELVTDSLRKAADNALAQRPIEP